jgi:hypothetical protein
MTVAALVARKANGAGFEKCYDLKVSYGNK